MVLTVHRPLLIDTIEFVVAISSGEQYSFLLQQLSEWKALAKEVLPSGKITLRTGHYFTRLAYFPNKKQMLAAIQLGVTKSKKRYAKLSLQLGGATKEEFRIFQQNLSLLFDFFTYAKVYETAMVTRIDFALDLGGRHPYEFIPFKPKLSSSHHYIRKDGSRGTLYLGSPNSKVLTRVYDRKRKLKRAGLNTPFAKCCRVEVQLRRLGLKGHQLNLLAACNPFGQLGLADVERAKHLAFAVPWKLAFLEDAEKEGSAAALGLLSKNRRKQAVQLLQHASAPSWDPHERWQQLSQSLAKLIPSKF